MTATTLIIAEKPSMARDIARVVGARSKREGYLEGGGYWVSWCIGHLAELCEPHEYDAKWKSWSPSLLPILPDELRVRPSRSGAAHLRVLHRLMRAREVGTIVNACDAGREGELIFRHVHALSNTRKPVRRLWISSLTGEAIRRGMSALRPGAEFDDLADAARARADADWLVGMNATRALTGLVRSGGTRGLLMSVGRVQTPTLALIVRREREIESFESKPFWQVLATFAVPGEAGASYEGIWQRPREAGDDAGDAQRDNKGDAQRDNKGDGDTNTARDRSRVPTRQQADAIADAVRGRAGTITQLTRKSTRERPPLLFDLTNLQKLANRRFRMSAKRTLELAQALYETHKLITYPRTDARYLTDDLAPTLPELVRALAGEYPGLRDTALAGAAHAAGNRRIFDNAQVGDHHAIIPTAKAPSPGRLSADERRLYDLIARRFLASLFPDAVYDQTKIVTTVAGHCFATERRVCAEPGWQQAEPPPPAKRNEPPLPRLRQDMEVDTAAIEVREGKTQPPKRYSEASLLGAMEHAGRSLDDPGLRRVMRDAGLGTPATRAAIIETLLKRSYIERQGRELVPTEQGRALIASVPIEDLLSAELTADWEQKLDAIARGRASKARFMDEIHGYVRRIVDALAQATPPSLPSPTDEVLGLCPVCNGVVTEGFKTFQCASGKSCSFVIFKRIAGRKTSAALVRVLLARGRTQTLKGFRSKRGKRFSAVLTLDAEGKVQFAFDNPRGGATKSAGSAKGAKKSASSASGAKKSAASASGAKSAAAGGSGPRCPACRQGRIITGRRAWGCSRWREGCGFTVGFQQGEVRVSEEQAERLFRRGQTVLLDGLMPERRARLVLDLEAEGNVRVEPGKRARRT
ncbi:DNA topoisomerase 3 [Haliangium ochraceum]|uniref:DNA topoisomerase n=1 Tax=Haliangium ochraceum (strain DSM 14365 / JCM 11303 / SMP-2) TaxID=502025 RepID=D0LL88_HALO1|nr:DNA topoisomerase 3 [Haliangium ochraceum]ACY18584.1 DNA topoisomerase III [Haliangium ochraceum DSM 14365]